MPYKARICWNSAGWEYPTGEAARMEGGGSYVHEHGFGHEEWLCRLTWQLDNWHYSFLQPVHRSHAGLEGQLVSLDLYTIRAPHRREYVGSIRNCEILDTGLAAEALAGYDDKHWLDDMVQEVAAVGGDTGVLPLGVDPLTVFNIRFRPLDFTLFDPFVEAAAHDPIRQNQRYVLLGDGAAIQPPPRNRREGTNGPVNTEPMRRRPVHSVAIERTHNKLQNRLLEILRARYHVDVTLERDGVDVQFTFGGVTTYIEVKSHSDAIRAIREALGQLLEYAYLCPRQPGIDPRLVIVAPGPRTPQVTEYLNLLLERFGLALEYHEFHLGSDDIDL